jgi:hypothetical protein
MCSSKMSCKFLTAKTIVVHFLMGLTALSGQNNSVDLLF